MTSGCEWDQRGSNPQPSGLESDALPVAPQPQAAGTGPRVDLGPSFMLLEQSRCKNSAGQAPKSLQQATSRAVLRQQESIKAQLLVAYGARGARTLNLLDWDQMRCHLRHSPKLLEQGLLSTLGHSLMLLKESPGQLRKASTPEPSRSLWPAPQLLCTSTQHSSHVATSERFGLHHEMEDHRMSMEIPQCHLKVK